MTRDTRITPARLAAGKAETVAMHSQGRWLSADCGNVKPIGALRK